MNINRILDQLATDEITSTVALNQLEMVISGEECKYDARAAMQARCAYSLVRRIHQYYSGVASENDLMLCIRETILFLGRIQLAHDLYALVQQSGSKYNLTCEGNMEVSGSRKQPAWLKPESFIEDVYTMKIPEEQESPSSGDKFLLEHTVFKEYKSFEQKAAVHTALHLPKGETLLIALPTGGGKSLVTQMLCASSVGMTLVIVPTVALALDQFYAAKANLINKDGLYNFRGDSSNEERASIYKAIQEKKVRILFTSPEAILRNAMLAKLLEHAADERYLQNVVIDEAHIVPDWGVYFRPDFQLFSIILRKWRKLSGITLRTFLLSATLSDDVVTTLFSLFGEINHTHQLRCDALRREPRYYFEYTRTRTEQQCKVVEAVRLLPKPMVVYVLEPSEAILLQKRLIQEGYKNIPVFTGETKDAERDRILKGWKRMEFDVVVATSAFGIGVDKPNVRTVIHACCPENLSRFYQEVGRGGRDGLPSLSLFMPCHSETDSDLSRAFGLVKRRVLTVKRCVIRWNSMIKAPGVLLDGDECDLDASTPPYSMTDEEADNTGKQNVSWNINLLLMLHRNGFIQMLDTNYNAEKNSYFIRIKLIQPEVLADSEKLSEALQVPRDSEYTLQKNGYELMQELINHPTSNCWGHTFRHLFPLSKEVCSGCPADPEGKAFSDTAFQLRQTPSIAFAPEEPNRSLERKIGSYDELLVDANGRLVDDTDWQKLCTAMDKLEIRTLVVPEGISNLSSFSGLVLDEDEFYVCADNMPYLFDHHVACVLGSNLLANNLMLKKLKNLERYGVRRVLIAKKNIPTIDGYSIAFDKL